MLTRPGCRWFGLALLLVLLAGCGSTLPRGSRLVPRVAAAMHRAGSYRLSGSDVVGRTTTRFVVVVRRNGDFSGSLDIAVPGTPTFSSSIVAVAAAVYVRSPSELQELGIASLPGNLNPATTWVLQPRSVANGYRQSLGPFIGGGLAKSLAKATRGRLVVGRSELGNERVWVVREGAGSSSLRLLVEPSTDHLLELEISGPQPVTLRYSDFGTRTPVLAPPSSLVYAPPQVADQG